MLSLEEKINLKKENDRLKLKVASLQVENKSLEQKGSLIIADSYKIENVDKCNLILEIEALKNLNINLQLMINEVLEENMNLKKRVSEIEDTNAHLSKKFDTIYEENKHFKHTITKMAKRLYKFAP